MLECFSLELSLGYSFDSGFLLALRPLLRISEACGSLVELRLAFIDGFSWITLDWFTDWFGVVFLCEQ